MVFFDARLVDAKYHWSEAVGCRGKESELDVVTCERGGERVRVGRPVIMRV